MAIGSRKSGKGPIKRRIQWVRGLAFDSMAFPMVSVFFIGAGFGQGR